MLSNEQKNQFSSLDKKVQDLLHKLQIQQSTATASNKHVDETLLFVALGQAQLRETVTTGNNNILNNLETMHTSLGQIFDNLRLHDAREELLDSLFDEYFDHRRTQISAAAQKTFGWIFEDPSLYDDTSGYNFLVHGPVLLEPRVRDWSNVEANEKDREVVQIPDPPTSYVARQDRATERWDSFPDWLESSQHSLYWIRGKAGAGKSTLMAYIIRDARTRKHLVEWVSPDNQLHILSHFFWKPGTPYERSVNGLLRSLLYQILMAVPAVADAVLAEFPFGAGRVPTWSNANLTGMLQSAIRAAVTR